MAKDKMNLITVLNDHAFGTDLDNDEVLIIKPIDDIEEFMDRCKKNRQEKQDN